MVQGLSLERFLWLLW